MTLRAGWGYHYPYDYPNGFRRARVDLPCTFVRTCHSKVQVRLESGEIVEALREAVSPQHEVQP